MTSIRWIWPIAVASRYPTKNSYLLITLFYVKKIELVTMLEHKWVQESNPVIIYEREMTSRAEKAMFKADEIRMQSKKEYEQMHINETASWVLVHAYQKLWMAEKPDDKYGFNSQRDYKNLMKIACRDYTYRQVALKKYWKDKAFFELKQRQWQDFLVRDEKRIKHCSCGERDNSAMVQCDKCFHWVHLSCAKLTEEEAAALPEFACSACIVKEIKAGVEEFVRYEAGEIDSDGNEVPDEDV